MRTRRLVPVAVLAIFGIVTFASAQVSGTFVRTGDMTTERSLHTATLLPGGRVLITGGMVADNHALSSAELYDPLTGSFVSTGTMTAARVGHTATLLPDGKVLVAGGAETPTAELYDPATGTFSSTGALIENRSTHAAVLLPNGKVLIAGGERPGFVAAHAELYDPDTGTFSLTGDYAEPLRFLGFTATLNLLPDGRVLLGGENPPEIYDPAAATFSTTGTMGEDVYKYGVEWQASTSLRDGTVLMTGGNDDITCGGGFDTAEIYDPVSGTFRVAGTMTASRDIHTSTLLRDGTVLLTGGGDGWCGVPTLDSAEIYDPARHVFVAVGKMTRSRSGHTATLLNDGTVLIAGGFSYWPVDFVSSAEIYRPAAHARRRIAGAR